MHIKASDLGYSFFESETKMIHETTKALNELGKSGALENEHHYITVQLRDEDGKVIGVWLDEIDNTAWQFSPVNPGATIEGL